MSAWETQELPVLRALAAHFTGPKATPVVPAEIGKAAGLSEDTVNEVLGVLAKARPPYVEGDLLGSPAQPRRVTGLTDRARRELERDDVAAHLDRHEASGAWWPEGMSVD